jgi:hypothetical protein
MIPSLRSHPNPPQQPVSPPCTRDVEGNGYRTCGRLRHQPEGSPLRQTESGSLVFGTAGPPRAALHPVSRRRSCLRRLSRCSCRDDSDFHLLISCMCVRTGCGVSPQCHTLLQILPKVIIQFMKVNDPLRQPVGTKSKRCGETPQPRPRTKLATQNFARHLARSFF